MVSLQCVHMVSAVFVRATQIIVLRNPSFAQHPDRWSTDAHRILLTSTYKMTTCRAYKWQEPDLNTGTQRRTSRPMKLQQDGTVDIREFLLFALGYQNLVLTSLEEPVPCCHTLPNYILALSPFMYTDVTM